MRSARFASSSTSTSNDKENTVGKGYSADTKLGMLLDDPAALQLLVKLIPEIKAAGAMLKLARGMSLRKISGYPQAKISAERLQAISAELERL